MMILMRIFGSERIAAIMDKLGAVDGEVISHPFGVKGYWKCTKTGRGKKF